MTRIWLLDAALGSEVARLPWVVDGISDKSKHREEDGVFVEEKAAIWNVFFTAEEDLELGFLFVQQPWFTDDLTPGESSLALFIKDNAPRDAELTRFLIEFPSYADELIETDMGYLVPVLVALAREDPRFLLIVADYAKGLDREIGVLLVGSFLVVRNTTVIEYLNGQPWFIDGLSPTEGAVLTDMMLKDQVP